MENTYHDILDSIDMPPNDSIREMKRIFSETPLRNVNQYVIQQIENGEYIDFPVSVAIKIEGYVIPEESIKFMIKQDPSIVNYRHNPLQYSVLEMLFSYKFYPENPANFKAFKRVLEFLLRHGADPNIEDMTNKDRKSTRLNSSHT